MQNHVSPSMNNLYEFNLKTNYNKLECDGLLFVEYQCMPGDVRSGIWSQHNYLAFIQSGKKTWITPDGEFPVTVGDAIFCKKGAHAIKNYYDEQFCALLFFIPDDFVKQVILESELVPKHTEVQSSIFRLKVDLSLRIYFESMISQFLTEENPSKHLLKLKFKELILQVVTANINPELTSYFFALAREEKANLKQVMLNNYLYRLSQEDFAKLTHRSLSSFKRDFQQAFGTSFTKWLTDMRLKHARVRLLTTEESISEVADQSGFDTTTHFIRCFKKQYNAPPQQFRQQNAVTTS
ncbi:AraC family transcriptional regulator [Chryseolinea lacunae]|uniref:Helix-turn-helix domain-containing protein n=1 Tax=Chryseolinea lacunae TaxID=2801331 RepID=A0ABS1KMC0_9BACT|nr:helix-turn-helix domain-containing protein [Chryseolinea lacunae]MBL0740610.1 helix-turn-helix domain-containing protein [Chryseolinea lacunae]